jgi:hydrogenase expression/formation protein HypE
MHELLRDLIVPAFENPILRRGNDQAVLEFPAGRLAFTTDSYVVKPLIFPGGTIGDLAINGTINDLAVGGATPLALSVSFILEEGLELDLLRFILATMRLACQRAGVPVVTGDTKVVERGSCDGMFINTSGVGVIEEGIDIDGRRAQPGDAVILSGSIGEHGIAIASQRQGAHFSTKVQSDTQPLHTLVARMLSVTKEIHAMRDPTRGGLATTLNEIADQSRIGIEIEEELVPIPDEVRGACELLGFDPLYLANEGKLIAFVPHEHAAKLVAAMREQPEGRDACIIGRVLDAGSGVVRMKTSIGGTRIVPMLSGEMLPRIC